MPGAETPEVARAHYLADTSVFARLAKPEVAAAVGPLVARGQIALCAPVEFELGYSARNRGDHDAIMDRLSAFESAPVTDADHRRSIEVQRLLAARAQHRALSLVSGLRAAGAASQDTANQAINNVASGFVVYGVWGDRGASTNESITYLEVTIGLQGGSPDIAMNNVIIEIADEDNSATLVFNTATTYMTQWSAVTTSKLTSLKDSAAATKFTAQELRDPSDTYYTPTTDNDNPDFVVSRGVLLRIFINANSAGVTINPQNTVTVTIIPLNGAPTTEVFTTPESFTDRLVSLA